jgi:hypothetical protein
MATTPLWVPLAVAGLAVVGTLAGVVFTQVWNSRLDERRWSRESERLREAQAREDVNRTYEHRRAAYVDFLQEFERLYQQHAPFDGSAVKRLQGERLVAVQVYGTSEAWRLALNCQNAFMFGLVSHPEDASAFEACMDAGAEFLHQVRRDLGVPQGTPAEEPNA